MLASRDANGRSFSPWLPLGWDFDGAALGSGAIGWQFTSNGSTLGTLQASPGHVRLSGLMLHAPANAALASIPHPAAQAGWQGDLVFETAHWQCALNRICDGEARLSWQGVRNALFPGRSFGDYELKVTASAGNLSFQVATQSGAIQITGNGEAPQGGVPHFDGFIAGDPDFLVRLPAIAGGAAQPTGKSGQFRLRWPPR